MILLQNQRRSTWELIMHSTSHETRTPYADMVLYLITQQRTTLDFPQTCC